jgi:hypothetical protein
MKGFGLETWYYGVCKYYTDLFFLETSLKSRRSAFG